MKLHLETRRHAISSTVDRHKTLVRAEPPTREEFSANFDRCFALVHAYVSRRVNDRGSCERIVRSVLAANLDVLSEERGEEELGRLKAASDRLIRLSQQSRVAEDASGDDLLE